MNETQRLDYQVLENKTQTITNKTIDYDQNTITNLPQTALSEVFKFSRSGLAATDHKYLYYGANLAFPARIVENAGDIDGVQVWIDDAFYTSWTGGNIILKLWINNTLGTANTISIAKGSFSTFTSTNGGGETITNHRYLAGLTPESYAINQAMQLTLDLTSATGVTAGSAFVEINYLHT